MKNLDSILQFAGILLTQIDAMTENEQQAFFDDLAKTIARPIASTQTNLDDQVALDVVIPKVRFLLDSVEKHLVELKATPSEPQA